ncbi:MAG TPA: Holliday junction resolvase RuvX [Selenomonas sp.]|nr:Holliday junction resolvase RuvX [Selenomonas sp.]
MKRYIALDVGDRTIGIAVSDMLGITAQGVETIRRKSLSEDLKRLGELMQSYETTALVLGWPKNMDGTEGERCRIVKEFAEEVKKVYPDVETFFQDERLSTVAAAKALIAADVSRKKRKKVIDKMAAVHILQVFLDGRARIHCDL